MIALIRTTHCGQALNAGCGLKRKTCGRQHTILEDPLKGMEPAIVYYEAVSL
jgi:hypothetical protein